jgi:hypothetical protein
MRDMVIVRSDGDTLWVGIPRPIARKLHLKKHSRLKVSAIIIKHGKHHGERIVYEKIKNL